MNETFANPAESTSLRSCASDMALPSISKVRRRPIWSITAAVPGHIGDVYDVRHSRYVPERPIGFHGQQNYHWRQEHKEQDGSATF